MPNHLAAAAGQAFVEYFGTWFADFMNGFGRVASNALNYAENRPIVAFAALAAIVLLYWVTRSK
ncbi:MAG: hypothetical protein HKO77_02260 [Gemmatimonadetes bacterium]|nr:hypothetical protein [Gemmatimonadota bacterium]NNM33076.1 hypothetical protein [Gemmatimonadota bacterium]